MTPDRWQQIEHLLDEVLARDAEERAAFLDEACANDIALRREVEALLAAEEVAPTFLDADALAFAAPALDERPATIMAERRVGPYRLVREVGHGGMGVVYLAEREEVGRQVALKLVRSGLADPGATERFLFEQRVLARLEHPHIARLYDVGVTADRSPYFAMEYVEGQPLDAYCDAHHLGVEARLRLFETVGQAVQHAHQHFVVHRDLKPSNILVTEDEAGCPQVKLLDFGIAKMMADTEEEAPAPTLTAAGHRLMTPAYAAPEQIKGEAVTAMTDVYSLGVVLYELLTGQRPYKSTGPGAAQAVLTQEPKRPSTAVMDERTSNTATETAAARATTTEHLCRRLQGDLDVICLKALQKEPERRYASAEAFVEDIKRHLAGLPVLAREATLGYRVRKFVRRHRVGAATTIVFVVLVLGFAVAMAVQQQATAQQRDRAQVEAQKAREVTDFMLGLFEANEPGTMPTDTITVRTLLARGLERAGKMESQPEVQAEMLMVMGQAYQSLGHYDQAESLLREALALQRTHRGSDSVAVVRSLSALGIILQKQGRYTAADSLDRIVLAMQRRLLGPQHEEVAATLRERATVLTFMGDFEEADRHLQEAHAILRTNAVPDSSRIAMLLNEFSLLRQAEGRFEEAEQFQEEALTLLRATQGPEHYQVAMAMNNLGLIHSRMGRYAAAESLYHDALDIFRRLYGAQHPSIADQLSNLAVVLSKQGKHTESAEIQRQTLAMRRAIFGDIHPRVAQNVANLAFELRQLGAYADAERLTREALALNRKIHGEQHYTVAIDLDNLAAIKRLQKDYREAERLNREGLAMWRTVVGEEHPSTTISMNLLGIILREKGDYTAADSLFQETMALQHKLFGKDHPRTANTLHERGVLLIQTANYAEAERMLNEALAIYLDRLGKDHPDTRDAWQDLAALYDAWDQPAKAAEYHVLLNEEG
jgi:serine/threonine-protein kinase